MGRWKELPFDLLKKIDENLELYQDKVRSKCVCTHWHHAFPKLPNLRNQPPWLLLPFAGSSLCGLFHPFKKKMFVIDLPEAGEKVCKGSDHGWVVTVQLNGSINVVNPLTRARFALPARYKFSDVLKHRPKKVGHEYLIKDLSLEPGYIPEPPDTHDAESVRNFSIRKIALSCAPASGNDFIAVAIYGETHRLAYCKLGDNKWTDLIKLKDPYSYVDITFCDGKLYTLNHELELMVCDDIVSCPKLRKLLPPSKGFSGYNTEVHLVNSSDGGIMVVRRKIYEHSLEVQESECCSELQESELINKTSDFEIYRMNETTRSGWIRMKSLAYEILFMGMGKQVGFRKRRGNKIYFTDQKLSFDSQDMEGCFDEGIFSFKEKEITKSLGYKMNRKMIFPYPIWATPNPY